MIITALTALTLLATGTASASDRNSYVDFAPEFGGVFHDKYRPNTTHAGVSLGIGTFFDRLNGIESRVEFYQDMQRFSGKKYGSTRFGMKVNYMINLTNLFRTTEEETRYDFIAKLGVGLRQGTDFDNAEGADELAPYKNKTTEWKVTPSLAFREKVQLNEVFSLFAEEEISGIKNDFKKFGSDKKVSWQYGVRVGFSYSF